MNRPHHKLSTLIITILLPLIGLIASACSLERLSAPSPTPPPQRFTLGPISAQSNLDALQSYRANLLVDFEGLSQDHPIAGHIEQLTGVTGQPAARSFYLSVAGDFPEEEFRRGIWQRYQIGETVHLKNADDEVWSQFPAPANGEKPYDWPDPKQLILLPTTLSTPPQSANLNGQRVQHYRFSQAELASSDATPYTLEQAIGEIWIATPGNYIVQYVLSASLRVDLPSPTLPRFEQGSLQVRYALSDINADLSITPPPESLTPPPPLSDLPRLPDAEIITALPTLLEYTSPISAISATLFYRRELTGQDWAEEAAEIFEEKAQLTFIKDDERLTIIILPDSNPGRVKASLSFSE